MREWEEFRAQSLHKVILMGFMIAIFLSMIPLPYEYFFWQPDWVSMVLFFWVINRPDTINIGMAFIIGLIMDIAVVSPMGQHALAYCISTYIILQKQRQINMYHYGGQSLVILGAVMLNQVIMCIVRLFYNHEFTGWLYFVSPFTTAILWSAFNKVMIKIFTRSRRYS